MHFAANSKITPELIQQSTSYYRRFFFFKGKAFITLGPLFTVSLLGREKYFLVQPLLKMSIYQDINGFPAGRATMIDSFERVD